MNLGGALYKAGRVEDAIRQYEITLRLKPDLVEARRNLELIRNQTVDRPPTRGKD
jgi:hypothetical protein